jgi:hypothetical protein
MNLWNYRGIGECMHVRPRIHVSKLKGDRICSVFKVCIRETGRTIINILNPPSKNIGGLYNKEKGKVKRKER